MNSVTFFSGHTLLTWQPDAFCFCVGALLNFLVYTILSDIITIDDKLTAVASLYVQ